MQRAEYEVLVHPAVELPAPVFAKPQWRERIAPKERSPAAKFVLRFHQMLVQVGRRVSAPRRSVKVADPEHEEVAVPAPGSARTGEVTVKIPHEHHRRAHRLPDAEQCRELRLRRLQQALELHRRIVVEDFDTVAVERLQAGSKLSQIGARGQPGDEVGATGARELFVLGGNLVVELDRDLVEDENLERSGHGQRQERGERARPQRPATEEPVFLARGREHQRQQRQDDDQIEYHGPEGLVHGEDPLPQHFNRKEQRPQADEPGTVGKQQREDQ